MYVQCFLARVCKRQCPNDQAPPLVWVPSVYMTVHAMRSPGLPPSYLHTRSDQILKVKKKAQLYLCNAYTFLSRGQSICTLDKKVYALHKLYLCYTCSVFAVCNNFFLFDVHFVTCRGINHIYIVSTIHVICFLCQVAAMITDSSRIVAI